MTLKIINRNKRICLKDFLKIKFNFHKLNFLIYHIIFILLNKSKYKFIQIKLPFNSLFIKFYGFFLIILIFIILIIIIIIFNYL